VGRRIALLSLVALCVAACGSTTQSISGVLVQGGGAAPSTHAPVPVPGYIKLSGPHATILAVTDRSGKFSLNAPASTYHIRGRPAASSGSFTYWCGGQQVVIKTGSSVRATVSCDVP